MSEEKKDAAVKGGDAELLARLQKLEGSLVEIERTGRQRKLISLGGLVLILLALAIFAANLWGFAKQVLEPESQSELMAKVSEDLTDIIQNDSEIRGLMKDIEKDVVPHVIEVVTERFREDMPEFRMQGEQLLDNLQQYAESDIKEKLTDAMADLLAELEQNLLEKYPTVTPEELQTVLEKSQAVFIEEITAKIEDKLDLVADDLGNLRETVDQFKDLPEYKELNPENPHKVQIDMIEAMLELVIYHINPERGRQPAMVKAEGGAE